MNLIDIVLNFFYPTTCCICNKISINPICLNCENKIKKEIINGRKIFLNTKDKFVDEYMYIFKYSGKIRELIIKYKFKEESYLYKFFSYIMLKDLKVKKFIKKYDFIICVPIHKNRKKERGYNQSELILKEICKNNKEINIENNILIKIKNIKPQSSLDKKERIKNIKNVYVVNKKNKEKVINKKILIFDDIYTTGSTANECAKILKKCGAQKIGVLTIARD